MIEALSWLVLAAIFIVIEIITLGLSTIWFAGGAFVAAIAAACGAGIVIQGILFFGVSIVLLLFTRPVAMRYLDSKTEKTNVEALVGQKALVTEAIDNAKETGHAKINGMEWTARAQEDSLRIPQDVMVEIVDIQGVKLIVKQLPQEG